MVSNPGGYLGMGKLHQERPSSAEEQDHLTVHSPNHAIRGKKLIPSLPVF
jgi:hypothetical protein